MDGEDIPGRGDPRHARGFVGLPGQAGHPWPQVRAGKEGGESRPVAAASTLDMNANLTPNSEHDYNGL